MDNVASTAETPPRSFLDAARAFPAEFAECCRQMPRLDMFLVLLAVWFALFQFLGNSTLGYVNTPSLFGWMRYAYNNLEDDRHCKFIPLVVLGLFWWKRRALLAVPKASWWPALVLVAVGLAFHAGGFLVQQTRLSLVGFFVGIYGLIGLVWGRRFLAASFFPFALFAFSLPVATMADTLTFPLRLVVTNVSVGVGHNLLGIDVIKDGTRILGGDGFNYDVAPACSGIRSLTVLLALTTIYGFMTFRAAWKRVLMVFIAIPLAVLGNVVRITGVIVTAEAFGERAGIKFHDGAGFVTFLVALISVMALGHWLREEPAPPAEPVL